MQTIQRYILILFFLCLFISHAISQDDEVKYYNGDETNLYAMNKQVGQFIKRFNMEEDQFGKALYKGDKLYRDNSARRKLMPAMFDQYNERTSGKLKEYFIDDVTDNKDPLFLNFSDKNWFAEVSATFISKGTEVNIILYLELEKENLGSKWIISNVYYNNFQFLFPAIDSAEHAKYFLHPQSHELDFMNLHKALENPGIIEYYASSDYKPDYLTLFFYQMKTGALKFKQINSLKFHFYQIEDWYFELSYFNRNEKNSGWLISNLMFVNEKEKKELLKYYRVCTPAE